MLPSFLPDNEGPYYPHLFHGLPYTGTMSKLQLHQWATAVTSDQSLGRGAIRVAWAMSTAMDWSGPRRGETFISAAEIGRRAGGMDRSDAGKKVRLLADRGYLTRVRRKGRGWVYRATLPEASFCRVCRARGGHDDGCPSLLVNSS